MCRALALVLAGLLGAASCAQSPERDAPSAVGRAEAGASAGTGESAETAEDAGAPGADPLSGPARALAEYAERLAARESGRLAAARKWGLDRAPLAAPAPPAVKPPLRTPRGLRRGAGPEDGLPVVITRVPTDDRVVFLTADDGDHKDPGLLRMLADLDVPVSAYLTDSLVRDGYGYFRDLRGRGGGIQNHTLHHPYLPELSYAGQRREICGQQRVLERETGVRPRLFRPPFGGYDRATLRAAASCGIEVVPLWTHEAFPDRMEYRRGKNDPWLRPGDIVLTHFRDRADWRGTGDMRDVVRRVLRTATEQGFAVARLEDYV